MTRDFDPYHVWLGIPPAEQPPSHYRLLGLTEFESDPHVIDAAADRQLTFLRKQQSDLQRREVTDLVNDLVNELSQARHVLMDPESRMAYDATMWGSIQREHSARTVIRRPRSVWVGAVLVSLIAAGGIIFWTTRNAGPQPAPPQIVKLDATAKATDSPTELAGLPPENAGQPNASQTSINHAAIDQATVDLTSANQAPINQTAETSASKAEAKPSELMQDMPVAVDSKPAPSIMEESERSLADKTTELPAITPKANKPAASSPVASVKAAVPDKAAQTEVKKKIKEQFKTEYAQSRKTSGKIALATALLLKATKTESTSEAAMVQRYAILSEALEFAAEAGDAALTKKVINELEKVFDVRPFELKERALSAVTFTGKSYAEGNALLRQYSELAQAAAKATDFATSVQAMQSAAAALKRPLFKRLKELATLEARRYTVYQDAYTVAKLSQDKLASDPNAPVASLIWGRFLCCYQEDWGSGLPLLAQSRDENWRSLAERELTKPTQAVELMQLGDDWLKMSNREKDPVQFQARERAILAWEAAVSSSQKAERPKFEQQFDERIAKLFGESLAVAKDADGVPIPDTESMDPGTEFTIEFWVATLSTQGMLISKCHTDIDSSVRIRLSGLAGAQEKLHFEYAQGNRGGGGEAPSTISDGHWHHLAITRNGETVTFFVDGESINSHELTANEKLQSASPWKLGAGKDHPPCPGQYARVRISNSVRYTDNFAPPKQYIRDISTVYLR